MVDKVGNFDGVRKFRVNEIRMITHWPFIQPIFIECLLSARHRANVLDTEVSLSQPLSSRSTLSDGANEL